MLLTLLFALAFSNPLPVIPNRDALPQTMTRVPQDFGKVTFDYCFTK
jgi:hypothetical protein